MLFIYSAALLKKRSFTHSGHSSESQEQPDRANTLLNSKTTKQDLVSP
jgi:hypothetical protein